MLELNNYYKPLIENVKDLFLSCYVIVDDIYQQVIPKSIQNRKNIVKANLSDSEIITIAIMGEVCGIDSENAWFKYVSKNFKDLFPTIGDRSRYNRTRRNLWNVIEVITIDGYITNIAITGANIDDRKALYDILHSKKATIIVDKGYISEEITNDLKETKNITLLSIKRSNSKTQYPRELKKWIGKNRKRIETIFSQLTEQFNISKVLANSITGFKTRIQGKILAHNLLCFMNQTLGKNEIGQIKHIIY
ncbi:hypothetical protein AN641_01885 [Candidatus Epulonipiscioides gigas]|nr:hypothetical protein AN641_01885 [Epulopiscium sp. SCG-C07WGA-EpuloA2]